MGLFTKKTTEQPTVEELIEILKTLSTEDKEKVIGAVKTDQEDEDKTEVKEAEQLTKPQQPEGETEQLSFEEKETTENMGETSDEKCESKAEDKEPQENSEVDKIDQKSKEESSKAELIAIKEELADLKQTVANIVAQFENQPFGATPAQPPSDEKNGRWEGKATQDYFNRK